MPARRGCPTLNLSGSLVVVVLGAVLLPMIVATVSGQPDRPTPGAAKERGPSAAAKALCSRYASPRGSDRAAGSSTRPYRSPGHLVESLRPGQTGCLRAGTYDEPGESVVLRFERAGRPSRPITVRSAPGERARLVGSVMVPPGADRVTLSDLDVVGDGTMNTIKIYAADVVVEDSDITNGKRSYSCMMLGTSDGGGAVRTIVRRNRFFDCGSPANENKDHAIYGGRLSHGRIQRNLFVNTAGKSIQLYPDTDATVVSRNVIDGGPDTIRGGIVIGGDDDSASSYNVVEHNVIAYAADYGIYTNWGSQMGSGNVARSNCIWGSGTAPVDADGGLEASDNVVADPGFVDRRGRDLRLRSGSPCRRLLGADTASVIQKARGCRGRSVARRSECRPPGR